MPRAKKKKNGNGKRKIGRPSSYDPKTAPNAAFVMCRGGATNEDLAFAFGMTTVGVTKWMQRYPEFVSAIKRGRDIHDSGTVERALLRRALGFNYIETTRERVPVEFSEDGRPVGYAMSVTKEVDKHVVPDVGAAVVWLTNRANICPVCDGSGYGLDDGRKCFECDGSGKRWRRIKEVDFTESTRKEDSDAKRQQTINVFGSDAATQMLRVLGETGAIGQLVAGERDDEDAD